MNGEITASRRIHDTVTSWPGVHADSEERGELAFKVGRREIGHLHGERVAHFGFPRSVWERLHAEGRIEHHPVFPERRGPAARAIEGDADVDDVIALLRINYERLTTPPDR